MVRPIARFWALALTCALTGCAQQIAMRDSLRFTSPEQQRQTEERALAGDNAAARRLAEYHYFVREDKVGAVRWYRVAARRGDAASKESLKSIEDL